MLTEKDFDGTPSFPLQFESSFYSEGWDIPTRWAIDANKQYWMDNAHGHPLEKCSIDYLLSDVHRYHHKSLEAEVCNFLGKKPKIPSWMANAMSSGWTPPADFNREEYES